MEDEKKRRKNKFILWAIQLKNLFKSNIYSSMKMSQFLFRSSSSTDEEEPFIKNSQERVIWFH